MGRAVPNPLAATTRRGRTGVLRARDFNPWWSLCTKRVTDERDQPRTLILAERNQRVARIEKQTAALSALDNNRQPAGVADDSLCQVEKCTWFTCAATRKALAAIVKLGFKPVLEGKNEASTT